MPVTREAIARLPIVIYPKNYFMNKTFHAYFAPVLEKETPVISVRLSTPYAMVYYCQQNGAGALLPERLPHLQEEQPQDRPNPRLRQPRLAEL